MSLIYTHGGRSCQQVLALVSDRISAGELSSGTERTPDSRLGDEARAARVVSAPERRRTRILGLLPGALRTLALSYLVVDALDAVQLVRDSQG